MSVKKVIIQLLALFSLMSGEVFAQSSVQVIDATTFIENIEVFNGHEVTVPECRIRIADPVRIGCFPLNSEKWFLVDRRFLDQNSIDRLVKECAGLEKRPDNCVVEVRGIGNMDIYKTPMMKKALIFWKQ